MIDSLTASATDPSLRRCRVAMVGAGYMAREHIRAFRDVHGLEIAGIHSRTRSRAEALAREFGIPNVCDSVAELHEKSAAELVVIAVPELSTSIVARSCCDYPWTLLIEKPAGYDVENAERIEAAARARGRRAYVALNRRHYHSTRRVVDDLATQSGLRLIKVQDQQDPAGALRAGQPQLVVDNWMYANSIHVIDYFLFLGRGAITAVDPIIRWRGRVPCYVAARISFESGDIGLYEAIWDGPGPWAVSVNTPDKRWEMRPLEQAAYQLAGERSLRAVEAASWDSRFKPGLRLQAELAARASLGESTDLPTLRDALALMRLTQAIYSAAE